MTKRFEEQLDPADVALLKMAVDQIIFAPETFNIQTIFRRTKDCGTTLCIGGHMGALAHPEYLKSREVFALLDGWMHNLFVKKNSAWFDLFYQFTFDGALITADNLNARVEQFLERG